MRAVAKRFILGMTAATQLRLGGAEYHPSRSAANFHVSRHLQGSIQGGIDLERPVAHGQHLSLEASRFAGGFKLRRHMSRVAKGLVLGLPAAAERRPVSDGFSIQADIRENSVRAVLAEMN